MAEAGGAVRLGAGEGPLARVLPEVVAQVDARLERPRAHRASKVTDASADVLVVRSDVRLEPGGFAEALVAVLAPDLSPDAVGAEVLS